MSLAPCSRCGQPVGEQEQSCLSCGQSRAAVDAPAPEPLSTGAPPSRAGAAVKGGLIGAVCAAVVFAGWMRLNGRSRVPAPQAAASVHVSMPREAQALVSPVVIGASPAAPPSAALSSPAQAVPDPDPGNAEAELAPTPGNLNPSQYLVYGVVYDLASKRPVKNARIYFVGNVYGYASTDEHGWYRLSPAEGVFHDEVSVTASAFGYQAGALVERNPSLASYSDVERRTVAEEADNPIKPAVFRLGAQEPLVELNLAMIPLNWPENMPPAMNRDAENPPIPAEPNERTCRYYGVVYDLATVKPLRRFTLEFRGAGQAGPMATSGKGFYVYDAPVMRGPPGDTTVDAAGAGYRPGLLPERDPPMRLMTAKQRRAVADVADLAFDPVPLPDDCDEGLVRFDLAAVPAVWPKR